MGSGRRLALHLPSLHHSCPEKLAGWERPPRGVRGRLAPANCGSASPFFPGLVVSSSIKYFSSMLIQALTVSMSVSREGAGTGLSTDTFNALSFCKTDRVCLGIETSGEGCVYALGVGRTSQERTTERRGLGVSGEVSGQEPLPWGSREAGPPMPPHVSQEGQRRRDQK